LNGELFLRAGCKSGETRLLDVRCEPPLRVLRPHWSACRRALAVTLVSSAGGLLAGDRLHLEVVLEEDARIDLRTQAATQLHSGRSSQRWSISLGERSALSLIPHPLVPHAQAEHHSSLEVRMATTAWLLLAESVTPGRALRGELLAYDELRLDTDVWREGTLVARERQRLLPRSSTLRSRLGPYLNFASAYALGPKDPLDPCSVWEDDTTLQVGVSELACAGYCFRLLGRRAFDLGAALEQICGWWSSAWHRSC